MCRKKGSLRTGEAFASETPPPRSRGRAWRCSPPIKQRGFRKQCPGAKSNHRHGEFQSPSWSGQALERPPEDEGAELDCIAGASATERATRGRTAASSPGRSCPRPTAGRPPGRPVPSARRRYRAGGLRRASALSMAARSRWGGSPPLWTSPSITSEGGFTPRARACLSCSTSAPPMPVTIT